MVRDLGIGAVPHGFRSSFRDWAAECSDAPREVCELALAHVNTNAIEAAYRRTDLFAAAGAHAAVGRVRGRSRAGASVFRPASSRGPGRNTWCRLAGSAAGAGNEGQFFHVWHAAIGKRVG